MRKITLLAVIVLTFHQAYAQSNNWLAVEGRITDSTGIVPLNSTDVDFVLEVYNPDEDCLIYSEEHVAVNLSSSLGYFNLKLGGGTNDLPSGGFAGIMSNAPVAHDEVAGSADCSYTPAASHSRILKIKYTDVQAGSSQEVLSQSIEIGFSQYAYQAQDAAQLAGKNASDFIQANTSGVLQLTQANLESVFADTASVTELQALIAGTSSSFGGTINAGAVNTSELADNAVSTIKIADGSVTASKLANTAVSTGSYGSATEVATFSVDAQGRLTSAANVTLLESDPRMLGLTPTEVNQLENINSHTISNIQWGFLAAMTAQPLESGGAGDFMADGSVGMTADLNIGGQRLNNLAPGNAGYPSISFSGDPDTGIYRPAADKMTFATGGTDQISIAGGNVGIGIPSPTEKLDVDGTVKATFFEGDGSSLTGINASVAPSTITATEIATGAVTSSQILDGTIVGADVAPSTITAANLAGGSVNLAKLDSSACSADQIMRRGASSWECVGAISNSQGILYADGSGGFISNNTSFKWDDSNETLNIHGSGDKLIHLQNTETTGKTQINFNDHTNTLKGYLGFGNSSISPPELRNKMYLAARGTAELSLMTMDQERLTILENGDTGIGTNNPASTLHVDGVLTVEDGTASFPAIVFDNGTDPNTGIYHPSSDQIAISTAGEMRMIVNPSGKVGIGTSSPAAFLDISGSETDPVGIQIRTVNNTNGSEDIFAIKSVPEYDYGGGSNKMYGLFSAPHMINAGGTNEIYGIYSAPKRSGGSSTKLIGVYSAPEDLGGSGNVYSGIFLNGNVGVGTATPTQPLEVNGNIKATEFLKSDCSGGYQLVNDGGSGGAFCFKAISGQLSSAAANTCQNANSAQLCSESQARAAADDGDIDVGEFNPADGEPLVISTLVFDAGEMKRVAVDSGTGLVNFASPTLVSGTTPNVTAFCCY